MESEDEDDSREHLVLFSAALREPCVFCKLNTGVKLPFCRVCAKQDETGIYAESSFAHRSCAEKRMNRDRKIKCPTCHSTIVMAYSGAVHEDYAMRNMRETFKHCFPAIDRPYVFNFLAVKNTLLGVLSLAVLLTFDILAAHSASDSFLIVEEALFTVGVILFLGSWFITSSYPLNYVILYGSIRRAKRHLISEVVLYICVAGVALGGAAGWRNLLSADTVFGATAVTGALVIMAIVVISVIDKIKVYSGLGLIGISTQIDTEDP